MLPDTQTACCNVVARGTPRGAAASGSLCCQQPKAAPEPAEPSGPPLAGAKFLPAESPEQTGGLHSSKHDLAAPRSSPKSTRAGWKRSRSRSREP